MEYIKTFAFAAIFIFLSMVCVINLINGQKEAKAAKEERKRKRSPFAVQKQIGRQPDNKPGLAKPESDKLESDKRGLEEPSDENE